MDNLEKMGWLAFYLGMIWSGIGICVINLTLLLGVVFGSTSYQDAMIISSIASSVLLISSAGMIGIVKKFFNELV